MKTIVLTGGPCSGKTTVLVAMAEQFRGRIQIVPEVATRLLTDCFPIPGKDIEWSEEWQAHFQAAVLPVQRHLEDAYALMAIHQGATLLVCDRGLLDGATYTPGGLTEFCARYGIHAPDALARYDAIVHLESLAAYDPAEYERKRRTNNARFEALDRAQQLERNACEVWKDHPQRIFLKGERDVADKIAQVTEVVRRLL